MSFSEELISWYEENHRNLPWRETTDPYKIWLSEVILQQTRVDQGMKYYLHFVEKYPDVFQLARSSEDAVLKSWQGLGYYSRARNLHKTAKIVSNEYQGEFPNTYSELQKLPGIGSYTAAAIASFCFGESVPVLDGNVYRVLSRYLNIDEPINSSKAKRLYFDCASQLISKKQPDIYNQAIMEFGALQCKPKNPDCSTCKVRYSCAALKNNRVDELPIKIRKNKIRSLHLKYFVIRNENELILKKRNSDGIWANLYEFPLVENSQKEGIEESLKIFTKGNFKTTIKSISSVEHKLSHRKIYADFIELDLDPGSYTLGEDEIIVARENLEQYGVHRIIEKFLEG